MKQQLIRDITSAQVKNLIGQWNAGKIFLVTGQASYVKSGASEFIDSALESVPYVRFYEFEQNPKYEDAIRGTAVFNASDCDAVIAIGGGSVIDMAKLINVFAANPQTDYLDIVKDNVGITKRGKSLLAIPTTAGTGSEATHFAVVYYNKTKYSAAHKFLLPDVAGLQHRFTWSQSKYLTACAAMDAFSQAMESYWSVGATLESMEFARQSLSLLIENMQDAVNAPDSGNRQALMSAAYLAGCAINISKTTAPHAVSYAFTTYYNIPHGHAVYLTLPIFLNYNYAVTDKDLNDPRGVASVRQRIEDICKLLGATSVIEAGKMLKSLARKMEVELSFTTLGITDFEEKIASNVNVQRLGNNPRRISKSQLIQLLKAS